VREAHGCVRHSTASTSQLRGRCACLAWTPPLVAVCCRCRGCRGCRGWLVHARAPPPPPRCHTHAHMQGTHLRPQHLQPPHAAAWARAHSSGAAAMRRDGGATWNWATTVAGNVACNDGPKSPTPTSMLARTMQLLAARTRRHSPCQVTHFTPATSDSRHWPAPRMFHGTQASHTTQHAPLAPARVVLLQDCVSAAACVPRPAAPQFTASTAGTAGRACLIGPATGTRQRGGGRQPVGAAHRRTRAPRAHAPFPDQQQLVQAISSSRQAPRVSGTALRCIGHWLLSSVQPAPGSAAPGSTMPRKRRQQQPRASCGPS
jgi:hypothetical protein